MDKHEIFVFDYLKNIDVRLKNIEKFLSHSKPIMNIDELCEFTGLSKSTIYKLTHSGSIPFYKKAKHLFFDKAEIVSWLKSNRGYNTEEIDRLSSTYINIKSNDEQQN